MTIWLANARRSQIANYAAAVHFSRMHIGLGAPSIFFSAAVGTGVFAALAEGPVHPWVQIGAGIVSVLAATLSALQTFFNHGERASKHRAAAAE